MRKFRKQAAAYICAAAMVVTALPVAPAITSNAAVLPGLTDLGRQVAAEGCVLIKNENNVLPLEGGVSISIFGRAQCNYYKSGTGSGGDVKAPYSVGILEGLRKNPKVKVNEDLAKVYTKWVANGHGFDNGGGGWAAEPWYQAEMPLTQDVADAAKAKSDVAVVLIGRTAGEDKDAKNEAGSYLLTDTEKQMLDVVTKTFDKVVVVLNVGNVMDMQWVDDYDIDSVLYAWQGGMNGGDGVADVLTGDVNPSGHLADTIAREYDDYPSSKNFGRTDYNFYAEDVYMGYRYFETFAKDKVLYPFGYGLSYTTFKIETSEVTADDEYISVDTVVTNTGERAGKESVQVYYGAPQGTIGNPAKELAAFAKTKLLQPGESQEITLSFKINDMAPYDDSGVSGHDSAYVLEAGDYKIYVGDNVRDSELEWTYVQDETEVVEQLTEAMAPVVEFDRMKPEEDAEGNLVVGWEKTPTQTVDVAAKAEANLPEELQTKDDNHYDLIDVYNGEVTTEEFVAQLSNTELTSLIQGEGMSPSGVTSGIASAFGGVNTMKDGKKTTLTALYGIPRAGASDGPSGIRQTAAATSLPGGASIACTWNTDLIERMFQLEGEEMVLNQIDTLLGPGINLHRNPLNGRNFEYYSEDPLVTGKMAAAVARGIQSTGATVTIKHFAANNQEQNRHWDDSRVSERALRQLYLKSFEIAIKDGNARSLMTSYNPINGSWAASNYDLTTEILRNEWGYTGIVMTDWWARMNSKVGGSAVSNGQSGTQYHAAMIKAQNDLYMVTPDSSTDKASNSNTNLDIPARLADGYLTRAELQRSAVNICNYLLKSQCFARLNNLEFKPYTEVGEDWFKVEKSEFGDPRVTDITVGGRHINTFNTRVSEYQVFTPDLTGDFPVVDAVAADGTTITIQQATKDSPAALIRASQGGEELIYRVVFTDEAGLPPLFDNPVYASLTDIQIGGESIEGFDPSVTSYGVIVDSLDNIPEITCTTAEGTTAVVTYDAEERTATIKCTTSDQAKLYTITFGVAPKNDDFDGDTLNSFWSITNERPDNWALEDGHLVITSEQGGVYQTENDVKNMFSQPAFGDWTAVTKVDLPKLPSERYHSMGVLAMQDQDNYINLKMEFNYNQQIEISLTQEKNGTRSSIGALGSADVAKFTDCIYFKLTKVGNRYLAAVSPDGVNYIKFITPVFADYSNPKFAITNGDGSTNLTNHFVAKFDYVHFTEAADTVTIGDSTQIKVAEITPAAISGTIKPESTSDAGGGWNFGYCDQGEYAVYKINVEKAGSYDVTARVASDSSGAAQVNFLLSVDDENVADFTTGSTGGWQNWVTLPAQTIELTAGEHLMKVYFNRSGMNLNWLQLERVVEPTIAKDGLTKLIAMIEGLDGSEYTSESWAAVEAALTSAKAVANNKNTTQAECDAAVTSLVAAFGKLEYGVQKLHLETAIKAADAILALSKNYEDTEALAAAVEAGKAVLNDAKASQEAVDNAAYAVLDELFKLAKTADISSLESLIDAAKDLLDGSYTSDSLENLKDAIEKAEAVVADQNRGDNDISDAYANLIDAIIKLEMKGNKAALKAMLAKANEVLADADAYVASTIEGLADVTAEAQKVYDDDDAVQSEVNAAVKTLTLKVAEARLIGDVDGDGAVTTSDSAAVLKASAEITDLDAEAAASADVNGDGVADTSDAALILQYAAEKISAF